MNKDYRHLQFAWGAIVEFAEALKKDYSERQVTRAHFQADALKKLIDRLKAEYFSESEATQLPLQPNSQKNPGNTKGLYNGSAPQTETHEPGSPWALRPASYLKK